MVSWTALDQACRNFHTVDSDPASLLFRIEHFRTKLPRLIRQETI